MQNQENKAFAKTLLQLRDKIDKIDLLILDLLEQRLDVVKNVKNLKEDHDDRFFIKSAREGDMIKELIKKSAKKLPATLIIDIWRKIISFSNHLEQPINIALHNPDNKTELKHIVQSYYNNIIPIANYNSSSSVIMEIEAKKSQIAVFSLPKNRGDDSLSDWWITLANNTSGIKAFAKIPLIQDSTEHDLVALAIKVVERSAQDTSLLCVEISRETTENQFLADLAANFTNFAVLKSIKSEKINKNATFYLVEVNNFLDNDSEELVNFNSSKSKPYVKILGVYPTQINI